MWKYLKSSQVKDYKFTRQKPIGNFIVDFYCSKLALIIEIDGDSHNYKAEYDKERHSNLKLNGFHILRFDGYSVLNDIDNVIKQIVLKIEAIEIQPPSPLC